VIGNEDVQALDVSMDITMIVHESYSAADLVRVVPHVSFTDVFLLVALISKDSIQVALSGVLHDYVEAVILEERGVVLDEVWVPSMLIIKFGHDVCFFYC